MYEHYAIIKDQKVIAYPVNPRLPDSELPDEWLGGEIAGKMFVYCHNCPPWHDYTKNIVENNQPYYNPETGCWYRGYDIVDASSEEIAERVSHQTKAKNSEISFIMNRSQNNLSELGDVPVETQQQWDTYFAELQDIKNQPGFPWNIDWPIEPNKIKRINVTVERI